MEQLEKYAKLECSVCTDPIHRSKKVTQCRRGHIVCEMCIRKLETCPECRVPLDNRKSPIRNLAVEHILDALSFDCPFAEGGCKEKLLRGDIEAHGRQCKFGVKLDVCKLIGFHGCDFRMTSTNIPATVAHLQKHECLYHIDRENQYCYVCFTFEYFYTIQSSERGMQSSTWSFIWEDCNSSTEKRTFLIVCRLEVEKNRVSWVCLDLDLGTTMNTPVTSERFDLKLIVPNNEDGSQPRKLLEWQIPIVSANDFEALLEDLPLQISIPYLMRLNNAKNRDLELRIKFPTSSKKRARLCSVMPNLRVFRSSK